MNDIVSSDILQLPNGQWFIVCRNCHTWDIVGRSWQTELDASFALLLHGRRVHKL